MAFVCAFKTERVCCDDSSLHTRTYRKRGIVNVCVCVVSTAASEDPYPEHS